MTFISLGILVVAFGASLLKGRPFGIKALKAIFIVAAAAIFSLLIYYSYQQYAVWQSAEPTKFLLPPYQSANYFIKYIGARFFAPYFISLLAGIIFFFIARKMNKKYEERFFEQEELWLGALALFIVGWPGLLFYFIGLILIYLIIHTLYFILNTSSVRISLYYWWLPLAIFVILINKWLMGLGVWRLLKI
ncbi:MAG: hypothetical protein M1170_00975 [Patescibacteria group bacterium]|nr:hypothetical protein [Patescibacteria group bacterium]